MEYDKNCGGELVECNKENVIIETVKKGRGLRGHCDSYNRKGEVKFEFDISEAYICDLM